jgi:hypothetical protein
MKVRLTRGGTIGGTVMGTDGPVAGAVVKLFAESHPLDRRHRLLTQKASVITGLDGGFEFVGLPEGGFRVAANPVKGSSDFADVYVPSTPLVEDSTLISVEPGHRRYVLLNLQGVRKASIAGQVIAAGVGGKLSMRRVDVDNEYPVDISIGQDGRFRVPAVPAGIHSLTYVLKVQEKVREAAARYVHVGMMPLNDISLTPEAAATATIRATFNANDRPDDFEEMFLTLLPVGADERLRDWFPARLDEATGAYEFAELFGAYRVEVSGPPGWLPAALLLEDGRNVSETGFTVKPGTHATLRLVMTNEVGVIEGMVVVDPRLPSVGNHWAVVFSTDESKWDGPEPSESWLVSAEGRFRIEAVRPWREYFVALCGPTCMEQYSADGLRALSKKATRVNVGRPGLYRITLKR